MTETVPCTHQKSKPMKLKDLNKHLEDLSSDNWRKLFNYISLIRESKSFGEWEDIEEDANGVLNIPHVFPSKLVCEYTDLMYELDLVVDFDWAGWDEGREIVTNGNYEALDNFTLIKILTAIIRNDRFCEGALVERFEDGTIEKILVELKKNIENKSNN